MLSYIDNHFRTHRGASRIAEGTANPCLKGYPAMNQLDLSRATQKYPLVFRRSQNVYDIDNDI